MANRLKRAVARACPEIVFRAGPGGAEVEFWVNRHDIDDTETIAVLVSDKPDAGDFLNHGKYWVQAAESARTVILDEGDVLWCVSPGIGEHEMHLYMHVRRGQGVEA